MRKSEYFEERGLDRIINLSDAVFAFSMTLLAVDLVVPELQKSQEYLLYEDLLDEYGRFLYFFLTFVITGAYWSSHHRIFRFITRYDGILMRLNLYFLLFILLMPFITKLISEYGDVQIAVIISALGYASPGILIGILWHYASTRYLLIKKDLPADFVRLTRFKNFISPCIFLLSIPVSFIQPHYAMYFWVLLIPVNILVNIRFPDILEED
jgi:uncharacterized membrane protein